MYLYTSFSDYVVYKHSHTGFISAETSMCKHCFLTSCWRLSAVLYCRCLTTPPNPGRMRLTVTPQMASLYSSSLMPVLSLSLWYHAWGKKWSVTVTQWLRAKSGTQRAVVYQIDWYSTTTCRLHVVEMFYLTSNLVYVWVFSYFEFRFKAFSLYFRFCKV